MDEANELRGSLQLIGTVKSVIFQNEENGYTVLRLDVGGAGDGRGLSAVCRARRGADGRGRVGAPPEPRRAVQGVLSHALAAGGGEAYL